MQPEQNPYDFIYQDQNKKSKVPLLPTGSKTQRIIIAAVGGGLLLVIFMVLFSFIFKGDQTGTNALVKAVQQQTEVIRVAEIGVSKAKGADARNLAVTSQLSLTTTQAELIAILSGKNKQLDKAELAAAKNSETDKALTAAEQSGQFDQVFIKTLGTELTNYQKTLTDAKSANKSKSIDKTLDTAINQVKILSGQ